nr:hypothetical protein [Kineosporia rhizophila]
MLDGDRRASANWSSANDVAFLDAGSIDACSLVLAARREARVVLADAALAVSAAGAPSAKVATATPLLNEGKKARDDAEAARARSGAKDLLTQWSTAIERGHQALSALGVPLTAAEQDTDADKLVDLAEFRAGTNPWAPDTDDDGLSDAVEAIDLAAVASPLKKDTDGDGTKDGLGDTDQDGLTDAREATHHTSPTAADTDGDGLNDRDELTDTNTDPLNSDSDADEVSDGVEIDNDLNPLEADSDGNGTSDAAETVNRVKRAAGATATVRGRADANTWTLTSTNLTGTLPGAVTAGVGAQSSQPASDSSTTSTAALRTTSSTSPSTVTLKLDVADTVADADYSGLSLMKFDPDATGWLPVDEDDEDLSYSTANKTVTVTSATLGVRYAVVDLDAWREGLTACATAKTTTPSIRMRVLLDASRFTSQDDPSGERFTATKAVVDQLHKGDELAVAWYAGGIGEESVPDHWQWEVSQTNYGWTRGDRPHGLASGLPEPVASWDLAGWKKAIGPPGPDWDEYRDRWINAPESIPEVLEQAGLTKAEANNWCRPTVGVLVSNGETGVSEFGQHTFPDPLPTDTYAPIHVMGVGSPSRHAWLKELAAASGGTYSEIPDFYDAFKRPPPPKPTLPDDESLDTDGDGASDYLEIHGSTSLDGRLFTSDPTKPDTDGDGLNDYDELGAAFQAEQLDLPAELIDESLIYGAVSDPRSTDGDHDGIPDTTEIDEGTQALHADTDSDGLADGDEFDLGTDPLTADTDGDELNDGYEVDNADNQGLSPTTFDTRVSQNQYLKDFLQGAICGDITWLGCAPDDSIARLAGSLTGSFVPLIDIRDAVAGISNNDLVGTGFSLAGLLPFYGDSFAGLGKIGKYVNAYPHKANDAAAWIVRSNLLSERIQIHALRKALGTRFNALESEGFHPEVILKIAKRGNIDDLLTALSSSKRITDARAVNMPWARAAGSQKANEIAEIQVQDLVMPILKPGWVAERNKTTNVRVFQPRPSDGRNVFYREHDVLYTNGADQHSIEVKSGAVKRFNRKSDLCGQMAKDRAMINAGDIASKVIHFVPSESRGIYGVGPDAAVLKCLNDYDIKFVIHIPSP